MKRKGTKLRAEVWSHGTRDEQPGKIRATGFAAVKHTKSTSLDDHRWVLLNFVRPGIDINASMSVRAATVLRDELNAAIEHASTTIDCVDPSCNYCHEIVSITSAKKAAP